MTTSAACIWSENPKSLLNTSEPQLHCLYHQEATSVWANLVHETQLMEQELNYEPQSMEDDILGACRMDRDCIATERSPLVFLMQSSLF